MSPPEQSSNEYRSHLDRSRRVWDRWSGHYGLSESDFEPVRTEAIEHLALTPGDRVLDVGCGPGVNFERLRDAVGPTGDVVGVDYSPEMVEAARDRVAERGWDNVTVRRADATTAALGTDYDAAVATLSLSVMPDVERAVANVHDALAPGGELAVVDLRPIPSGPLRIANPLLALFFRWFANWNPEGDVICALDATFAESEVISTSAAGVVYTVIARRGTDER